MEGLRQRKINYFKITIAGSFFPNEPLPSLYLNRIFAGKLHLFPGDSNTAQRETHHLLKLIFKDNIERHTSPMLLTV